MPAAQRTVEVGVSPDTLMAIITDFASYPTFLPEMEEATVLRHEGDTWVVRFAIRIIRRIEYTLELRRVDPLHLTWSLVEGAFRANTGGWALTPLDEGRRTRAEYRIDLDLGMFVPGSVLRTLLEHNLPATLAAFKGRAEGRGR